MPMERPRLAEYNSRHGVRAARVSSEGSGREGESSPHRLESFWAAFALTSQGDLSVKGNVWLPGSLVFGEQDWIGIGRPVQVAPSFWAPDKHQPAVGEGEAQLPRRSAKAGRGLALEGPGISRHLHALES